MAGEASAPDRHSGDCTIYASMDNGMPTDGICTCGYGLRRVRECDYGHVYARFHPAYSPPGDSFFASWEEFVGPIDEARK